MDAQTLKPWLIALILQFGLCLTFGCSSFSSSSDKETANLQLQLGTQELQNGSYPQALTTLLKAESLDPENAAVQNNLGLAYYVRDKYQEAESHIRKAIALQAGYSDAHNNLGRIYIEAGRYNDAIAELKIAENDLTYVNPERPLINLGLAYFRLKNYAMADSYLIRALNIQRDNCTAHSTLGRSYYEQKDYEKSATELDRAAAFCQKILFDEPLYYSALSFYELGQIEKAQVRLEQLTKLYPSGKYFDKAKSMLEIMRK